MTRVDRLRADGWTECGTCGGWYALPGEEPDWGWSCAHGLVPPDGMVEAAAEAIFEKAIPMLGLNDRIHVKDIWRLAARAALVAAARWEAPGE